MVERDLDEDARRRRVYGLRVALFYAALFLIYGVHVPYLPVWLDWRGLSPAQIGVVMAAPFFIRLLVTPSVAFFADQRANHRRVIASLALLATAAALALAAVHGFWAILLLCVLLVVATHTIMPLIETIAVRGVRTAGLDYGRMRLWGSATFIAAGFAGGVLIDGFGAGAGIWLIAAGAAATATTAFLLPQPVSAMSPASAPTPPRLADAARLAGTPIFLMFLLAAGAVHGSLATFYTFGALHWRGQGISSVWIGVLWAIGVAAEILLFAFSNSLLRRLGPPALLIAGAAGGVVRWAAMAAEPPLALLVPLQLLHGLTYGATHLGAIHFISRAVPERAAGTAQALYATVAVGLALGLATIAAGRLYAVVGGQSYLAMAALAAAGFIAAIAVRRSWDGGELQACRAVATTPTARAAAG
jgi:MFS transporter, PPP family, 3-phenylpropionic acid transporter